MANINCKKENEEKSEASGRRIYLTGEFCESATEKVVTNLIDLEAKNPLKDILLYINSYGGIVDDFFAMHDAMKMLRCNVATIGIGKQMSCGFLLLISGTPGLRFATANSRILIHQVSSGFWGPLSQIKDEVDAVKILQERINEIILKYTKIKKSKLEKIMERQYFVYPPEAKELGIIDDVIDSNMDLYSKIKI